MAAKNERFTMRLSAADAAALKETSERLDTPMSALVRKGAMAAVKALNAENADDSLNPKAAA